MNQTRGENNSIAQGLVWELQVFSLGAQCSATTFVTSGNVWKFPCTSTVCRMRFCSTISIESDSWFIIHWLETSAHVLFEFYSWFVLAISHVLFRVCSINGLIFARTETFAFEYLKSTSRCVSLLRIQKSMHSVQLNSMQSPIAANMKVKAVHAYIFFVHSILNAWLCICTMTTTTPTDIGFSKNGVDDDDGGVFMVSLASVVEHTRNNHAVFVVVVSAHIDRHPMRLSTHRTAIERLIERLLRWIDWM